MKQTIKQIDVFTQGIVLFNAKTGKPIKPTLKQTKQVKNQIKLF